MDEFYHCIKTVLNECQKTGLALTKDICKIDNSIDINFDLPVNRIAFLYKFGTFNIHFFKKCFLDFASDCPEFSVAFNRILSSKLVCSLSNGPGTDIIGLQLAVKELGKMFNGNTFFKIISKYGSWRNTMNFLIESKASVIPITGNFKLLQCNIMESLSSKAENCLKSADIILMDHAFASPNAQKVKILDALKILLQILKPGAYIFFIDTKNKVSYFELLNLYGTYIYGPKAVQVDDVPYNETVAEQIGEEPVHFGKACFGVWQKKVTTENVMADGVSFINVIPAMGSCDKDMYRSIENMTAVSNPIKLGSKTTDQASVLNATPTSQNLRGASCRSDSPQLHTPPVNLLPAVKRQGNISKTGATSQQQILTENSSSSKPCDESKGTHTYCSSTTAGQQATKQNAINTEADCTEDIKALLSSLNNLVLKLESFVSSEIALKNSCLSKCGIHNPTCHNPCFSYNQCFNNKITCHQYCEVAFSKNVCSNANRRCDCYAVPDKN